MSLEDTANALKFLGADKKTMAQILYDNFTDLDGIEKAIEGVTDKGGILNSLFASLTSGAKSFGTALKGFFLSPAAKIIGVILAITAAMKLLDMAITTPKEATEAMSESFGEFEDAQSDVENINNELEETKNKIADLQAKGNLTLVEKEELRKLKETQKLLEMQKVAAEETAKAKAEQAAMDSAVSFNKNFNDEISQGKTDEYRAYLDEYTHSAGKLTHDEANISANIAALERFTELRDESDPSSAEWDVYNKSVRSTTESIWAQVDALTEHKSNLETSKETLGSLTSYQQSALDTINSSLDYIYKTMSPEAWKQMKIDEIFNKDQFSGVKEQLTELAKKYSNLTDFTNAAMSAYGEFNTALLHNGIKMSDVAENIFAEAGIIDTDSVRNQLYSQLRAIGGEATQWIHNLTDDELELVYEIMLETNNAELDLKTWQNKLEEAKLNDALNYNFDIAVEQEGLDKVNSAIAESESETGLLTETIESLKSRYRELENFDAEKLFRNTANGVKLNTQYLSELESKYEKLNTDELTDALGAANTKLEEAQKLLELHKNDEYKDAYQQRVDYYQDEVEEIQRLIAMYNALNGAYAKALKAQETPNDDDAAENTKTMYESAKKARKAGKIGTDDFRSFLELMNGKDYDSAGAKQLKNDFDSLTDKIEVTDSDNKVKKLKYSITSFFEDGQKGANNFVDAVDQAGEFLGKPEWVQFTEGKGWEFNATTDEIAEALNISKELADILKNKLKAYGWNINTDEGVENLSEVNDKIQDTGSKLRELQGELDKNGLKRLSIKITNQSEDEIRQGIKDAQEYTKTLRELDDTEIKPETKALLLEDTQLQLQRAYQTLQQMNGEKIDMSSVADGYEEVASTFNDYKDAYAKHQANVDTYGTDSEQAKASAKQLDDLATKLSNFGQDLDIPELQFDGDGALEKLETFLNNIKGSELNLPISETTKNELDEIQVKITTINGQTVTIDVNMQDVQDANAELDKLKTAIEDINNLPDAKVKLEVDAKGNVEETIELGNAIKNVESKDISITVSGAEEAVKAINEVVQALSKLVDKDVEVNANTETPTTETSEGGAGGTIDYTNNVPDIRVSLLSLL